MTDAPAYETLEWTRDGGVVTLRFNRPEAANALDMTMGKELLDASIRCDESDDIGAVVLTGSGRMFCAGADIKAWPPAGAELAVEIKELTTYLHAAISRFTRMRAPLICAVNGAAAGAGMSLSLIGDLAYAAESAWFTMAYSRIGMTPDGSSTYFLPRIVGLRRARELSLTNRRLTAQEAAAWGLVNYVVPDADLLDEARKMAAQLAAGPTETIGAMKRLYHAGWTDTLESQMETETREIAASAKRPQAAEGIAAFLEKREPDFS